MTAKVIADMIVLINGLGLLGGLLTGKGVLGKLFSAALLLSGTTLLPDGGQGLGRMESGTLARLENMPGGATKENRDNLIQELKDERSTIGPIDVFSRKSEIDNQIKFLESGQLSSKKNIMTKKFDFNEMKIVPIDNRKINKINPKQFDYRKNPNISFIPINLNPIEKNREIMLSKSSVATNVLHISSKNVSDPYRKLTPDYYGIYV